MMYEGVYDLPIFNWWEVSEKDDLKFLLKEPKKVTKRIEKKLKQRWAIIKAEFFDKIALDKNLERLILKKVKLQSLRCDILLTGDNHTKTLFIQLELEIESLEKEASKNAIGNYAQKSVLDKFLGRRVDPKVTPVMEYYSDLKQMSAEFKRQIAEANRRKK